MYEPALPAPRGPLSERVVAALRRAPGEGLGALPDAGDPYGEDVQLTLYICYELHYRSFGGVDPAWEWDPDLLRLRGTLERAWMDALRADTGTGSSGSGSSGSGDGSGPGIGIGLDEALAPLLVEAPGARGVSHHLLDDGTLDQFREYVVHRSIYHLKEADPHALLIPRLTGRAKAGVVAVEFDEYGGGRAERMHARLFADLMAGLGLDPAYGRYLDRVPAAMLATVNLMSLFALHRGHRAMMAGHFAAAEIGTPPSAARLAKALDRLGVTDPACALFFTEHVEADAVHEQLMRREVVEPLVAEDPALEADVVFGIRAGAYVEERLSRHLLGAWAEGRTSLRPAPDR